MKKFLFLFSLISAMFFFSCASTPENQDEFSENQTESENLATENSDDEIENSESPSQEDSDEDFQYSDSDDVIFLEDEEDNSKTAEDIFPKPEDFEEPLVLTLEAPEEKSDDKDEKSSDDSKTESLIYEEIQDEELLKPATDNSDSKNEDDLKENFSEEESDSGTENDGADENQNSKENDETQDAEYLEENQDDDVIFIDDETDEIDGTEEESDDDFIENDEVPSPSRKVSLKKNEYLEVTYPGTGWIFLGLTDGSRDIAYYGTKLGTQNTTFSLQARKAGTKLLHFYRNDALTNEYIDDYIEVEVLNENGSNKTHIAAPDFTMPLPKIKTSKNDSEKQNQDEQKSDDSDLKQSSESDSSSSAGTNSSAANTSSVQNNSAARTNSSAANTSSVQNNTAASTNSSATASTSSGAEESLSASGAQNSQNENQTSSLQNQSSSSKTDSKTLLQEANILYNEKEFSAAKNKLNQFFENPSSDADYAYFLLGQILEAKSEIQDIKAAINAYTFVTKNYPASKYWEDSNKRIIYLKRFYLEAR